MLAERRLIEKFKQLQVLVPKLQAQHQLNRLNIMQMCVARIFSALKRIVFRKHGIELALALFAQYTLLDVGGRIFRFSGCPLGTSAG